MQTWHNWVMEQGLSIRDNFISHQMFSEMLFSLNAFIILCQRLRDRGYHPLYPPFFSSDQVEHLFAMLVGAVKFKRSIKVSEVERQMSQLLRLLELDIKMPYAAYYDRTWPPSYEDPKYTANPDMTMYPSNEDFIKMDGEARAAAQTEMRANGMAPIGSTPRAFFENPTGVEMKSPTPAAQAPSKPQPVHLAPPPSITHQLPSPPSVNLFEFLQSENLEAAAATSDPRFHYLFCSEFTETIIIVMKPWTWGILISETTGMEMMRIAMTTVKSLLMKMLSSWDVQKMR